MEASAKFEARPPPSSQRAGDRPLRYLQTMTGNRIREELHHIFPLAWS